MIIKRVIYGRKYSLPNDRFFQDGILKHAAKGGVVPKRAHTKFTSLIIEPTIICADGVERSKSWVNKQREMMGGDPIK